MDTPGWEAITSRLPASAADEATVADILAIAQLLDVAGKNITRWLEVSPLLTGIADKVQPLPLDLAIDEAMDDVQQVCRQPHTRLQSEELLLPAGRARRLAPSAPHRLATHSEDWERWTFHGVQPRRILARHYEASADIYENRTTALLIDHLRRYLARRSANLGSITRILVDYDDLFQRGSWRVRERLSQLLEGVLDKRSARDEADRQRAAVERRRRRLEALTRSPLWQGADRRAAAGSGFHSTNLFRDHPHYRKVAWLWRQWAAHAAQGRTTGVAQSQHEAYRTFSALIVVQALDALGYKAPPDAQPLVSGGALQLTGPSGDLEVQRSVAGIFQFRLGGTAIGTLVPVLRALDQDSDFERMERTLDELAAMATGDAQHATPCVMLYPGDQSARRELPGHLQWRLDSVGHDLPAGSHRLPVGFIPVTPQDLASVERVIAALRWLITSNLADIYPPVLPCPSRLQATVLDTAAGWTKASEKPGHIRLRRPATPSERDALLQALAQRGRQLAGKHRGEQGGVTAFREQLTAELTKLDTLSRCQLCGTVGDPLRSFHARDDLTFWFTCPSCSAEWGTQRCGAPHCGLPYPAMEATTSKETGGSAERGLITEGAAERSEQFATSCCLPGARARAMICSRCGTCPEARRPGRGRCARCG